MANDRAAERLEQWREWEKKWQAIAALPDKPKNRADEKRKMLAALEAERRGLWETRGSDTDSLGNLIAAELEAADFWAGELQRLDST